MKAAPKGRPFLMCAAHNRFLVGFAKQFRSGGRHEVIARSAHLICSWRAQDLRPRKERCEVAECHAFPDPSMSWFCTAENRLSQTAGRNAAKECPSRQSLNASIRAASCSCLAPQQGPLFSDESHQNTTWVYFGIEIRSKTKLKWDFNKGANFACRKLGWIGRGHSAWDLWFSILIVNGLTF